MIKDDYERLMLERPATQEDASGTHYGSKAFESLATKREVRNVSCNLCWTNPSENSALQQGITLELVENFAADMYLVTTARESSRSTSSAADDSANGVAAGVAAIASSQTVRDMALNGARSWKVPARAPRFYAIPIAIQTTAAEAEKRQIRKVCSGLRHQRNLVGVFLGQERWGG